MRCSWRNSSVHRMFCRCHWAEQFRPTSCSDAGCEMYLWFFFPTCQVRVVRFYQSCSQLALLLRLLFLVLLRLLFLLLQFLLHHLCLHFHVHFRLANSSPSSSPTSELSVHRWTSTWDLPSSVCTAGPQPGTFPAQCAPLDLNLGPAQLSVHRWTSTWDLPGSVCTAGPQPGTCPAQCALVDLNGQIECQKICHRTVPKHLATLAIEYRRPYGYCLERAAHHRTQTCPKRLGLYGPRKESPADHASSRGRPDPPCSWHLPATATSPHPPAPQDNCTTRNGIILTRLLLKKTHRNYQKSSVPWCRAWHPFIHFCMGNLT